MTATSQCGARLKTLKDCGSAWLDVWETVLDPLGWGMYYNHILYEKLKWKWQTIALKDWQHWKVDFVNFYENMSFHLAPSKGQLHTGWSISCLKKHIIRTIISKATFPWKKLIRNMLKYPGWHHFYIKIIFAPHWLDIFFSLISPF